VGCVPLVQPLVGCGLPAFGAPTIMACLVRERTPNTFSVYQCCQIIAAINARQHRQAGLHIGKKLAGQVVGFVAAIQNPRNCDNQ